MAGWGPNGEPVVLSSSWDQEQEAFRFSLEYHDPKKDVPEEIESTESFRDDDALPFACRQGESALKCFWNSREREIRRALARLKVKPVQDSKFLELPPYEVDWIRRPSADLPPMSLDVGSNGIVFHLPDTSMPGNHLLPLGMVRSSSPHARWLVMRLESWDRYDDGPIERGVRFLRMPEPERPVRRR